MARRVIVARTVDTPHHMSAVLSTVDEEWCAVTLPLDLPLQEMPVWPSPVVHFPRFAPRPLSHSDPRSASVLPPFARARRFLEHVAGLDGDQWARLAEQASAVTEVWWEAERHVRIMFVTPSRRAARDAVMNEARRVVDSARARTPLDANCPETLGSYIAAAALALVLRDLLPPELFERLYGAFVT
ncbi:MAG: hypothetical protein V4617_12625 [Gemmatimonadota bacterium]